ncbi:MAG: hypothetical protein HKN23_19255 [Verrucomicrobiales bacterium]|nr:hypothetical protein [Verrucomicrobiales bacterium]
MRIVAIADDDLKALEGLPESADLLVSLGDVSNETILEAASQTGAPRIFAVKGNHDSDADFPDGVIDLHRRAVRFQRWTFGGFGGCWKYKRKGHHLFEQEEVDLMLDGFPTIDIFIAHNSPAGVHERDDDVYRGFEAFTKLIEASEPYIFLHGHQHIQKNSRVEGTEVIGVFGNAVIDLK